MNKNIFKGAKFGDAFKTRDGRKAVYVERIDHQDGTSFHVILWDKDYWYIVKCHANGTHYSEHYSDDDIIGKWHEPISEEELEKLAWDNWEKYNDKPSGIAVLETYKDAYRKAEEKSK